MIKRALVLAVAVLLPCQVVRADERYFTYSYEASVLPKGEFELEQWVTNSNTKRDGHYSKWDYRTEVEYGVTNRWTTAVYGNWNYTHSQGVTGVEERSAYNFDSFSWENIYQLTNPILDPIGSALYLEYSTDGTEQELEGKILLSKVLDNGLNIAFNSIYEAEWEPADGDEGPGGGWEREATLQFTGGVSYKLCPEWAIGLESRYIAAYPDGLDLKNREFQAVSVGPNIHYGNPQWWATLTFLPQVWGDGDGAKGGRNLVHEESMEIRLIAGIIF